MTGFCSRVLKRMDLIGGSAACKPGRQVGQSTEMQLQVHTHLAFVLDISREQLIPDALSQRLERVTWSYSEM